MQQLPDLQLERAAESFAGRIRVPQGVRDATVHLLLAPFDGGGAAIDPSTQQPQRVLVAWECIVIEWRLVADVAGQCAFDIRRVGWATYPSSVSIVGGANPALGGLDHTKAQPTSAWSPRLHDGDTLLVSLLSAPAPTVTYCCLALRAMEI